jgi:hypothetical protein
MTSLKLTKCDYGVETLGLAKKKRKKKVAGMTAACWKCQGHRCPWLLVTKKVLHRTLEVKIVPNSFTGW